MKLNSASFKIPLISFACMIICGIIFDLAFDAFIQLTLIYIFINMLLGMSLNLVNGITGQFSLGHAGFMAVGAYTSAWLSTQFPAPANISQVLYFIGFGIGGGALAGLAGYLVGLPSLRLKGDYLAVVTLGFSEIIRVMLLNMKSLGAARGMYGIPGPTEIMVGSFKLSRFMNSFFLSAFWVIVCYFFIWRLMKSKIGRDFLSVREDEIAAEAMGINTTSAKVKSFVISSFFAGIAGSITAHFTNYLNPSSFTFNRSIDAVIIVVLGGMGSMSGALIAAAFITIIPEALRPLQETLGVDLRMVIYSLSLILLMILRPKGIFGNTELTDHLPKLNFLKRKKTKAAV